MRCAQGPTELAPGYKIKKLVADIKASGRPGGGAEGGALPLPLTVELDRECVGVGMGVVACACVCVWGGGEMTRP